MTGQTVIEAFRVIIVSQNTDYQIYYQIAKISHDMYSVER